MNTHHALVAFSDSIPFIPLTVIIWVQNTDNLLRIISLVPPIVASVRALAKTEPGTRIVDLAFAESKVADKKGTVIYASLECTGRPVISNIEVRLIITPPVNEHYFELVDYGDHSEVVNESTHNPQPGFAKMKLEPDYSEFRVADIGKLRKGDTVTIKYPRGSSDAYATTREGKSVRFSTHDFIDLDLKSREYTMTFVVQGETTQGNTYEMRKKFKSSDLKPEKPRGDNAFVVAQRLSGEDQTKSDK